jgi:subfamily B ATP-binding cassette protein MsbA
VKEFKRLLRYAEPYRGRLILGFIAMVCYAIGSAAIVQLIKPLFDKVLEQHQRLGYVAVLSVSAFFLKSLGDYGSDYLMTDVGLRVVTDLRNQLFRHTLGQSATFFSRRSSGQLLSRLTNDVNQVQRTVSETVTDLVRESMTGILYIGCLFSFDARLALVSLTTMPLVVYALWRLGQRVRRTTRRSQESLAEVTHLATEAFVGQRIVKAFGAEDREGQRFAMATQRLYRTYMKVTAAVASLPPLMEFIGGMAAIGAVYLAADEIAKGTLDGGGFTAFLATAFMLYTPLKRLSRVNAGLQQSIAAAERIFELLDTNTEVPQIPNAPMLARPRQTVEFRNVGFAYDDAPDRFILRHVSLTANAGQVVAIVGLSGAGKTTLANLIPRFYDVKEGAILIDGVDIRQVNLASLRQAIALVTQDTVLFDDTIANNIAYGAPGASRQAIEAAARAAHAHEFIEPLSNGYDARIGERGQRLSGGQRQRLAIARAILKDAPLLVLDEATSSLDVESELLVQDALANLMRNRTTFVIAHRLSTVRHADCIMALEHGEVVETGRHEDLVTRPGGLYAKLYALQAFDERDEAAS